jgi:hypothetical protein
MPRVITVQIIAQKTVQITAQITFVLFAKTTTVDT